MLIPWILQIALDQGLCSFFHDQFKLTLPPKAKLVMDYVPPSTGVVWVTFAMTFGNIPEDSIQVWHYSGDERMKRHLDPMWYSLGIGASFEYPLWIYVSTAMPHVLELEVLADEYVTADITLWMCEFTRRNFEKFRKFIAGIYNFFNVIGTLNIDELNALKKMVEGKIIMEIYPELKNEVKRKLMVSREIIGEKLKLKTV